MKKIIIIAFAMILNLSLIVLLIPKNIPPPNFAFIINVNGIKNFLRASLEEIILVINVFKKGSDRIR